ncbi:MAG: phosphatase PAP2 family protein [Qingshengfaniella sp.]
MMIFWWLWGKGSVLYRRQLLALLGVTFVALVTARMAQNMLPFSTRPLLTEGLAYRPPAGVQIGSYADESSLPSDHAAMFFAIAFGLFTIHRGAGLLALIHAALVPCLPRIYLGMHWPSDIVAGIALAAVVAFGLMPVLTRRVITPAFYGWWQRHMALLYPLLFLATYLCATMFVSLRRLIKDMALILSG